MLTHAYHTAACPSLRCALREQINAWMPHFGTFWDQARGFHFLSAKARSLSRPLFLTRQPCAYAVASCFHADLETKDERRHAH